MSRPKRSVVAAIGWALLLGCAGGGQGRGAAPAPRGTPVLPPVRDFVFAPAGSFTMGSPESEVGRERGEKQREVRLTHGFWIQEREVTQAEWAEVTREHPAYFASCGGECPIENIDWYAALAYTNARSDAEKLGRCYTLSPSGCDADWGKGQTTCTGATFEGLDCAGYRLPIAAEWEYAFRAGTRSALPDGELVEARCGADPVLERIGWYCHNAGVSYGGCVDTSPIGGPTCAGTHPVGKKKANPWGLYDMAGNVWEYVWDRHGAGRGPPTDPLGPDDGENRVLRGGSWHNGAGDCRAARHNGGDHGPGYRGYARGFRMVRTDR